MCSITQTRETIKSENQRAGESNKKPCLILSGVHMRVEQQQQQPEFTTKCEWLENK